MNHICNPTTRSFQNSKYRASITGNSVITCDEIMEVEETETVIINFNEKKMQSVTQKIYVFYLPFHQLLLH